MNMFPSTYYTFPQEIIANLHYSRRLLLPSPFQYSQPTPPQAPPPTTPQAAILDPAGSSHANNGFDANIIMILAGLLCALICSLCINTLIRCVIKCSSLIRGEPIYYLNMINHDKNKPRGLDKRALKTFPVVKYSNDVKIKGLINECVICLSEFKGGEKVRIMPICNHGFHVKCIDKWLSSHSSCPTCRQSLLETCKKIIGCDHHHHHHQATSPSPSPSPPPPSSSSSPSSLALPSSTSTSSREVIIVSIVPLEREDLVRNYRGEVAES